MRARDARPGRARAGGNPIVTDIYTADPDAFVVGDTFYIDTDQDEAPLGAGDFLMRTWHMYSSTDAEHWSHHGTLLSLTDFPWANRNAWAPQMVQRDGKFYWYLPMQKAATNSMSIGVAVGDSPTGPFHDALGKPLIDNTTANHSSFDIDPTVLVDDDGQAYIYWGSFSSPRVAKLKDNMVELQELGTTGSGGRVRRQARRRAQAQRQRRLREPAGRRRQRPERLHDLGLGQPGGDADVVADLRLRREHDARTCSWPPARARRRASRSRPAATAPSSSSTAPRRWR